MKPKVSLAGLGLIVILVGTALLSLQNPARENLVPYAPYFQLGLQIGVFLLLFPLLRIRMMFRTIVFFMLFYILFLVALTSALWSGHSELVFRRTLMVMITSGCVALLALSDSRPLATFGCLAKALALFGAGISLVGLLVYFLGELRTVNYGTIQVLSIGSFHLAQRVYGPVPYLRLSSLFGNPNTLASWLLVTITLTMFLIFTDRRKSWWILFVLQLTTLILTFSRAGIFAAVLSLLLFLWFSGSRRGLAWSILCLLAIIGIMFLIKPSLLEFRRFSFDLNLRQLAWQPLWEYIHNNPFSGVGFGASYEALLEPEGVGITAHNAFLAIWSEVGILGFILWLCLWLFPVYFAKRFLPLAKNEARSVLSTTLALTLSLLVHQFFEASILRYGFHTLLWVYLLTLMVHLKRGKEYIYAT
ncbi:O-antigen ligase family protein [Candidatus Caldatribacterium sp. SIUC1]|uniref:O-antigen ligase family protein n=1 Tax=Candidatus Caldatribacterium sp. SIUC1 TaxID=3418365 RepID=UPI003F68E2D0